MEEGPEYVRGSETHTAYTLRSLGCPRAMSELTEEQPEETDKEVDDKPPRTG